MNRLASAPISILAAFVLLGAPALNFAGRAAESARYAIIASRPENPPSRNSLEAEWLRTADLPLNNVLGILGVELDLAESEYISNLDTEEQAIIASIQNERAIASG